MTDYKYNPWPLGKLPKELQRPEPEQIRELGYDWKDPRDIVDMFEKKIAEYSGSRYAVAVDCCSNGIFLALKYLQIIKHESLNEGRILIPNQTYISVPMQIFHAGLNVDIQDVKWQGIYPLEPTPIYDSAGRFTAGMYMQGDSLQVLSFQIKKRLPIGRGGMILTNDPKAYSWLKLLSYDGRNLKLPYNDENHVKCMGYHMYMTPEDAARGLLLFHQLPQTNEDTQSYNMYPPIEPIFKRL